ncbi:hypothetical protein [Mycobacterium sp. SMC-4]|uniref:hypothetical protein n=1 Tax=Mycobacterium sp. SMC-4 TaxID=2857059 RepID=UPI0021B37490|nr:hypothetical protein [Mycobacterium sp. SMC-4]UXA16737.1 hypothetical protein KXD98_18390 [Mycobacterium sp. SMC-4]
MGSKFERDLERQLKKLTKDMNQTISVPTEGSESAAVAAVIKEYKKKSGVTLDRREALQLVREARKNAEKNL